MGSDTMRPLSSTAVLKIKTILLSGDVETNPGPFPGQFWKKDEDIENLQKTIDDQEDEILDLKDIVDKQKEDIEEMREKLESLLEKVNFTSINSKQNSMNVSQLEEKIEREKESSFRVFEEMKDHDAKLDKELITQKESMNDALTNIVRDLNKFRSVLTHNTDESETY